MENPSDVDLQNRRFWAHQNDKIVPYTRTAVCEFFVGFKV